MTKESGCNRTQNKRETNMRKLFRHRYRYFRCEDRGIFTARGTDRVGSTELFGRLSASRLGGTARTDPDPVFHSSWSKVRSSCGKAPETGWIFGMSTERSRAGTDTDKTDERKDLSYVSPCFTFRNWNKWDKSNVFCHGNRCHGCLKGHPSVFSFENKV